MTDRGSDPLSYRSRASTAPLNVMTGLVPVIHAVGLEKRLAEAAPDWSPLSRGCQTDCEIGECGDYPAFNDRVASRGGLSQTVASWA